MREKFREVQDRKLEYSQREKLEKLVNGQDVCLFQQRGSRKFDRIRESEGKQAQEDRRSFCFFFGKCASECRHLYRK